MIRKIFKKRKPNDKIDAIIKKYKIPREYLSINRKTVANAMMVGLFFAMIPMPMQMVAVVLCVPFLKFNVPLGVSLVWITNPVTMPIIFYGEYLLGNLLLFRDGIQDVELTLEWFQKNLDDIFLPMYLGAFVLAITLALGSRYLITHLWKRSVHYDKRIKKEKTNVSNQNRE